MRRLRGAVDDEVGRAAPRTRRVDPVAVADVEVVVLEPASSRRAGARGSRSCRRARRRTRGACCCRRRARPSRARRGSARPRSRSARSSPVTSAVLRHVKGVFGPQRGGRRPGHTRRRRAPAPDPRRRLRGRPRPPLRLHPGLVAALEGALRGGRRPDRDAVPRPRRRVAVVAGGGEPVLLGGRVVRPRAPRASRGSAATRTCGARRPRPRTPLADRAVRETIRRWVTPRWQRHLERILERERDVDAVVVFTVPPSHLTRHPDRAARALRRPGRLLRRRRADEPARVRRHGHRASTSTTAPTSRSTTSSSRTPRAGSRACSSSARGGPTTSSGAPTRSCSGPLPVEKQHDVVFYGYGDKFRRDWMETMVARPSRAAAGGRVRARGRRLQGPARPRARARAGSR